MTENVKYEILFSQAHILRVKMFLFCCHLYDKFGFRWLSAFTKQLSSNIFLCKNNKPPSVLVPLYYAYANFSFICAVYELHTYKTKEIHIQTLTAGMTLQLNSGATGISLFTSQTKLDAAADDICLKRLAMNVHEIFILTSFSLVIAWKL